jgi:hypothetical protein
VRLLLEEFHDLGRGNAEHDAHVGRAAVQDLEQVEQQPGHRRIVGMPVGCFDLAVVADGEEPVWRLEFGGVDGLADLGRQLESQPSHRACLVFHLRARFTGDDVDAGRQMR